MFPIIFERDTPIIDWPSQSLWATTLTDIGNNTANVRSNGVLNPDYATLFSYSFAGVITTTLSACLGVHLAGPQPGSEFTAYQVSVVAMALDPVLRPYVFMGESPASITTAAGGDVVTDIHALGWGDTPGTTGAKMEKEVTFVVNVNTADRGICVGVGLMAGITNSLSRRAMVRLCVRRLVGPQPRVIDVRKL